MSRILSVSGTMYEANTVSITDEELKSLLAAQEGDDDFWENLDDLHDRLMSDSEINGFIVSEGEPYFSVSLDGENLPVSDWGVDYEDTKNTEATVIKPSTHILVFEKLTRDGYLSCELDEEFDKESLDLSATAYTLPTGNTYYVVEPWYTDHDFEPEDSWSDDASTYIVTKEGEVIELTRA